MPFPEKRDLTFTSQSARLQYTLLMLLFRFAVTRGLYGRFAKALARIFPAGNAVCLSIDGAPPFRVALDDGYWTRFALWHTRYEPEVAHLLKAAAGQAPVFYDLGANKGYWTVFAASLFDHVIAAEASAHTYAILDANAGHLPNVTLHHVAIHAQSGQHLTFVNVANSHASGRLLGGGGPPVAGDTTETVATISIDDLVPPGPPALIKLDVEGAEVSAFAGAGRVLRDGAVIIYEDHGSDPDCAPSRHFLADPDMQVFSCEHGLMRLHSIDQIRALKTDTYKGYNFFAARAGSPLLSAITASLKSGKTRPGRAKEP